MDQAADVAIVGGGAAGLASAIFAAQAAADGTRIVVLDGAKNLRAKILVSGGGRCNVTNEKVVPADFNGSQTIIRNILAAFDVQATIDWFASLGVELKREPTGKLFPVANSAHAVLDALLRCCGELSVSLQTESRVTRIVAPAGENGSFTITHAKGEIQCRRVIFCTGGRSLPRSGSDGAGWKLIEQLGHCVTPTYAALVPLVLAPQMFHASIAGIALDVELSTFIAGKRGSPHRQPAVDPLRSQRPRAHGRKPILDERLRDRT